MIKKIVLGVLALASVLLLIAYLLPRHVTVERSVAIAAPPEAIFDHVNSLKASEAWSPWMGRDPQMTSTYSGPESGVGSRHEWQSDHPQVGSGSQEIIESDPGRLVRTHLDFGGQGQADAYMTFEPADGVTNVVWGFESDLGYSPVARYFGLLFDRMVGPDYEQGLANLKTLVESHPAPPSTQEALEDSSATASI